jgi:sec-independent protein translocase protein TatA
MFLTVLLFESPQIILLVVVVAFLLFGSAKLPQLAKSLGQSRKAFREAMREAEQDEAADRTQLTAKPVASNVAEMSDEELMAEMRRRVETKQI